MLSNLRFSVSEDLLVLSVQESPNQFAFRVLSLNFWASLVTHVAANNSFPFYHDCHGPLDELDKSLFYDVVVKFTFFGQIRAILTPQQQYVWLLPQRKRREARNTRRNTAMTLRRTKQKPDRQCVH